ncbi:beta-galactosidase [Schumannella soli]|uniref:Glycoside hydrolase 35 catalytic domain-containing protein n=1 Tax=Schumannella soli TaxID=2590779 RepID=A0A506Y688_9MICO|nr:beta-galactosidase [Schumannella soli]TPW77535.1 hypothetical protein FJ657_02325 [Schumannella soli]
MTPVFPDDALPISGEVQFWRLDPDNWDSVLGAVRELGLDTIATYLSWRRHEPDPGTFDLSGRHGPELDVHRFLELCRQHELRVILKPGPWICAEERNGGFPDWIVDDDAMIALDWQRRPVSGYNPPFKHPMPSYASRSFRDHVEKWITAVWQDLLDYTGPDGPIVATQYDNEPSVGFQDSMYGFDYHPEAVESWRAQLGVPDAEPPTPRVHGRAEPTDLELSWQWWQRTYIRDYLTWLADVTSKSAPGLAGSVNLNTHPVRGWPQDGGVLVTGLPGTVVGEDHYFVPPLDGDDLTGMAIAAGQARLSGSPLIWAPEMQAGIWRSPGESVDYPDPTPHELEAWWGASLALGYQGFNWYMLADRDNWELAPIDPQGRITPVGEAARRLIRQLRAVGHLRSYRPEASRTIAWTDAARASAYRVRGTQAHPVAPWDDARAREDYGHAETQAHLAFESGHQFDLAPQGSELSPPSVRTTAPGCLVRVHRAPGGAALIWVVRWTPAALIATITVELDDAGHRLEPADGGEAIAVDRSADGVFCIPPSGSAVQLFVSLSTRAAVIPESARNRSRSRGDESD